jgi:hypothetical protein
VSIVGTAFVAWVTIYILYAPEFELKLIYVSDSAQPVTDATHANLLVSLKNRKHFIGFKGEEIFYSLVIEEDFVESKEFGISTPDGFIKKSLKDSAMPVSTAKGNYYYFRLSNKNAVHPQATTDMVLFKGDFSGDSGPVNICAVFSTPYGTFPQGIPRDGVANLIDFLEKLHCKNFPADIEIAQKTKKNESSLQGGYNLLSDFQATGPFTSYFQILKPLEWKQK